MSWGGVSGTRFVWPLARAWVLEYASSAYSGAVGSRGSGWGAYKVSQGAKPDNCQGREFLLVLVGSQLSGARLGGEEIANSHL